MMLITIVMTIKMMTHTQLEARTKYRGRRKIRTKMMTHTRTVMMKTHTLKMKMMMTVKMIITRVN